MSDISRAHFKTYGLTHIALAVKNVERTVGFYEKVFGMEIMYREESWAQMCTPGTNDIIVFEQNENIAGKTGGGIMHFGFRLIDPEEISKVIDAVTSANAEITSQGEFVPGEPYVFFKDPDGYEIEVWYEKLH
ncbi:MAG: VOC family protein [Chitinophagales bacterium]|nr:VOC family protein [Chitinophagales bacterium]